LFFKLRRERIKIANLICERDEADALLAERLGVTPKRLAALVERVDHRDYSLEAELFSESNATLLGTLPSPEMNQEELALAGEFSLNAEEAVRAALELLDQRERYIVEHRLLADREAEISLADIGRMLGVSRERARQLETRAKKKLYAYITTHQGARDWLDLPSAA
jgi:RNA polymerase sigma-32 factor